MLNDFLLQQLAKDYTKTIHSNSNSDFEINDDQFKKYKEILNFFRKITENSKEAEIEIYLDSKEIAGGLTCKVYLVDVYGKNLQEFMKIVSYCSAISIDTLDSGKICISINVPNVFVEKQTRMMN